MTGIDHGSTDQIISQMADTQVQQIEGLPPGAILKPIQQPAIQGLPPGAILRPIGSAPTVNAEMERAQNRDYGQTSMSPGTTTFDQAHPQPKAGAAQRFAQGAGIPTSQSETTEAVRGMLNPQADPNENDKLLRAEEQIPVLGGDFRARATLAKRADKETGAVGVAHRVASYVPLAGPAVAAAQDEFDKGNYAGAAGAGLNALLSMEGLKGSVTPKAAVEPVKSLGQETTEAAARPPVSPSRPVQPVAGTLSSILGGGEKAMAKTPIKQQTAAGNATNLEVAQYAKDNGIDLTPAQATGSKRFQAVQAVGERALLPGDLPETLEKQKAAFGNLVDDFKQRVGTEAIPDTEAAGTSLKSQAQHGLDILKTSAQADYQGFQQQAGDIPVDLSDVKAKAAASLASQAEALKNVPAQYANPVRNVLKKLSDLQAGGEVDPKALADFNNAVDTYGLNPEQQAALRTKLGLPDEAGNSAVKMSTAQQLRSAYLDISRDYSGNVTKSVQRYAAQAAKDIDAAMSKAADQVGATDQWRQANAKWKQLQQTYNNPEHPLYKVLQEPDPSKVPTRLLGKGNYGGSPQTVRQLQESGIDISPLKREVAQQISQNNFSIDNGGNKLGGFSTQFLKTLFSPEEFLELTKIGRVGRAIRFEMNPSGTSNVASAEHQMGALAKMSLKAPLVPAIAARLTTSKALARAAMPGLVDTPKPRGLPDILGSRGPEPPPETPPPGAAPVTPPSGPAAPVAPGGSEVVAQPRSLADVLAGKPDERTNLDYRSVVDKMTPEEQVGAIFRSKLTDLPNGRAYDYAKARLADSHPHIGFADIDDFKEANTKLGEHGVDTAIFPAVGDLMRAAVEKENGAVHAFHVHGDEFNFLSSDPQAISRVVDTVNSQLKDISFQVQKPDGTIAEVKGLGFSHGTGPDEASAAAAEQLNKQARKEAGLRIGSRDKTQDQNPRAGSDTSRQQDPQRDSRRQNVSQPNNSSRADNQENPVNRPSLSDILSGKPKEKIDLNAPKSKRKIPPDTTAKADKSGQTVGLPAQQNPNFKKWFGDSQVRDDKGKPLVVYHGSNKRFDEFKPTESFRNSDSSYGGTQKVTSPAFFFTDDKATAQTFAKDRSLVSERLKKEAPGKPQTQAFYLRADNPLDLTTQAGMDDLEYITGYTPETWEDVQRMLDDNDVVHSIREHGGYDAVKLRESNGANSWAVFDPTQIKSATRNKGTFNPKDPKVINKLEPADLPEKKTPRSLSQILSGSNA